MIEQLNNFSFKSFDNYTGPPTSFSNLNLIFGYNGRGKSSLAKGILDSFVEMESFDQANYRRFDKNFVTDKMLIEQDTNEIKAVRVLFGEKPKNVDEEIKKHRNQLNNVEEDLKQEKIIEQDIRQRVYDIFKHHKGGLNIKNKVSKDHRYPLETEKLERLYNSDLNAAKKIEPYVDKIKNSIGNDDIQKEFDDVNNYDIPKLSLHLASEDDIKLLNKIFEKNYSSIQIPSSTIIKWLEDGLHLHHDHKEECLFCGNYIEEFEVIETKIQKYTENERQTDIKKIDDYLENLINNRNLFEILINQKQALISILPEKEERIITLIESISEKKLINDENIKQLENKIKDFNSPLNYKIKDKYDTDNELEEIQDLYEEQKIKTLSKFHNQEVIVKGAIAYNVLNDPLIDKMIFKLKKIQSIIKQKNDNNKKINKIINELKNDTEDAKISTDFMDYMNAILNNFSLGFKLEFNNDLISYNIIHEKHTEEKPIYLTINDISEGEKNLFALLYFYYELYNDDQQTSFKDEIKLIIIDDPISSLDDQNRFSVLQIIRSIAMEEFPQIFIMTHVWDDFCQLSYHLNKKDETNLYEVLKDSEGCSHLITEKNPVSPYRLLFKEILDVAELTQSDRLSDAQTYHIPNAMRKVLEEFFTFKTSITLLPQISNIDKIEALYIDATKEDNSDKMSGTKRRNLAELLDMINVLSHKPIKSNEIPTNARFLLNFIKDIDPIHFNSLKNSVSSL